MPASCRSRLESILNVAQRLRLRCFLRLLPCWTAILSTLSRSFTSCISLDVMIVSRKVSFSSGLGEVLRQRDLHLIPFDSDGTAGDGDSGIFRSLAGLHVESPSVPWTFDDAAI